MTVESTTPALPGHLEVWLACQREPESDRYNVSVVLEFVPGVDERALRGAVDDVLRAHPALRSQFLVQDGELNRLVVADPPPAFVTERVSGAYDRERALRLASVAGRAPFDLTVPPLVRGALFVGDGGALLAVTMHHIVSDGWSSRIFADDLVAAYRARTLGGPGIPDRGAPAVPVVTAEQRAEGEEHWISVLRDAPSPLVPVPDLVPDDGLPGPSASVELTLSAEATDAVRALARRERSSPAVVLLSAWSILLHAWSGRDEGTFGMVFAGRDDDTEELIDLRSRTLPLRDALDPDRPFADVMDGLRDQVLDSLMHADISAHRLQEIRRTHAEGTAVERTVFMHTPTYEDRWTVGDTAVNRLEHPDETTKYEFAINVVEGADWTQLRVYYDSARYRAATAELFAEELRELVARAAAEPMLTCGELLAVCDPRLLERTEHSASPEEPSALVPDLVLEHAAARPDAVAVRHGDRTVTYGELVGRAGAVANWLRGQGVRTGDTVAILTSPGADTPVLWLATVLAGAAYLPLDPAYPEAQLQLIADDARPVMLITDPDSGRDVELRTGTAISVPDLLASAADEPAEPPRVDRDGSSTFCVLYTSGTTGRPKGVVLPHRGLARLMGRPDFIPLDASDVVAQLCPLNFDGASYEIWGALAHGGELVVLDKHVVLSPRDLRDIVRARGITTLLVTTPLLNRVIEDAPDLLQSLRRVYFGGELISVPHMRRALRWCRPGVLLHSYGPTENSFTSTWHPVTEVAENARTLSIGKPVPGTFVRVVMEGTDHLVPRGVAGELLLGGVGIADGYLGAPEQTAARFVPDPLAPADSPATLYRTGDRVRWTPDGLLEFIGRNDNQVKIRSQRVELGEVEAVLDAHHAIESVFVTTRRNQRDEKEIVAYAVTTGPTTPAELRRFATERLPTFAVPRHIVLMSELPLTPTGKIDRRELPAVTDASVPEVPGAPGAPEVPEVSGAPGASEVSRVSGAASEVSGTPTAPMTPATAPEPVAPAPMARPARATTVESVRGAWQAVLEHDSFGFDQNFFDAGGHSLLLVRLQEELRVATGVAPSIIDLMRNVTVEAQSALVAAAPGAPADTPPAAPAPAPAPPPPGPVSAAPAAEAVPATSTPRPAPVAAAPEPRPADDRRHQILAVSATTAEALGAARHRLARHLDASTTPRLDDVARTLDVGRVPFDHRFAVVAGNLVEAARALDPEQPGTGAPAFAGQVSAGPRPAVVFAFADCSGPSAASATGALAHRLFPAVRDRIDRAAALLGTTLPDSASGTGAPWAGLPARTVASFVYALQVGIAEQFALWGVTPAAVYGTGSGRSAAATVCGALAFDDGVRHLATDPAGAPELPLRRPELPWITGLGVVLPDGPGPSTRHLTAPGEPAELLKLASEDTTAVVVADIGTAPGPVSTTDTAPGTSVVPTLAPDVDDDQALLMAVAGMWCQGVEADLTPAGRGRRIRLPGHPLSWAQDSVRQSDVPTRRRLAAAWRAVLGTEPDENSDLFDADDERLKLLRLRQRIGLFAGTTPSAAELAEARTFGRMAELLDRA
ncbi:amino acid adenylation domain-containing protein [Streptomyces sp. AM 4-1-1]|uniref:non-ribosomal peptide synthetase n=1 Tax=Streptomyces sp. AM 4-1-1 TaxID=3028710 RepID=UPI0023BA12F9|nr:non-ribosomal peptide synthetase [Streptomyces sp. AM 4-1-1]WEH35119.1 amino acid adenylation domain-containing protein [Streptomyces sp. AM 4-1-1]